MHRHCDDTDLARIVEADSICAFDPIESQIVRAEYIDPCAKQSVDCGRIMHNVHHMKSLR